MIGFFILRQLIELYKVSTNTRDYSMTVYSCPSRGKHVTQLNGHRIHELYDLECETPGIKKATLSLQSVHPRVH